MDKQEIHRVNYYTGTGSVKTPPHVLKEFESIALILSLGYGFTLRTGVEDGAERAFRRGADTASRFHPCGAAIPKPEIYLPWKGYNGTESGYSMYSGTAYRYASTLMEGWGLLPMAVKQKNVCDMSKALGMDLLEPSAFVLCWTPGGRGNLTNGLTLEAAGEYGIRVIDAGAYKNLDQFRLDVLKAATEAENDAAMAAAGGYRMQTGRTKRRLAAG